MVKKINAQQFENEAKNSAVAVVDFSATWCGPCKMLAPVLEKVSAQFDGKVDFYNVDVDDAPELAGKYNVNSVPCLILMKNGKLVSQSVGFKPEPVISAWINGNI
ncbi:MAG: thioredoxin [Clostridiales bacterium]|nr:thioredoxin [Clostridiales bacterium]